jgi:hypothetical protein
MGPFFLLRLLLRKFILSDVFGILIILKIAILGISKIIVSIFVHNITSNV